MITRKSNSAIIGAYILKELLEMHIEMKQTMWIISCKTKSLLLFIKDIR